MTGDQIKTIYFYLHLCFQYDLLIVFVMIETFGRHKDVSILFKLHVLSKEMGQLYENWVSCVV